MPQFDFANVFVPQFAWLALFFVVLYFGVVQRTLPKLGKVMGQREDQISGDIAAAQAAKTAADAIDARLSGGTGGLARSGPHSDCRGQARCGQGQ